MTRAKDAHLLSSTAHPPSCPLSPSPSPPLPSPSLHSRRWVLNSARSNLVAFFLRFRVILSAYHYLVWTPCVPTSLHTSNKTNQTTTELRFTARTDEAGQGDGLEGDARWPRQSWREWLSFLCSLELGRHCRLADFENDVTSTASNRYVTSLGVAWARFPITLSLPSSKSTFSQPVKDKCISEVVRIGSIIVFHLSKLWKAKFFMLCDVIFLMRLQGKFEIAALHCTTYKWEITDTVKSNGRSDDEDSVLYLERHWSALCKLCIFDKPSRTARYLLPAAVSQPLSINCRASVWAPVSSSPRALSWSTCFVLCTTQPGYDGLQVHFSWSNHDSAPKKSLQSLASSYPTILASWGAQFILLTYLLWINFLSLHYRHGVHPFLTLCHIIRSHTVVRPFLRTF